MAHPRTRPSAECLSFAVGFLRSCSHFGDLYNHLRLLEPIGHVPSAEAKAGYSASLEDNALVAYKPNDIASGEPGTVHIFLFAEALNGAHKITGGREF